MHTIVDVFLVDNLPFYLSFKSYIHIMYFEYVAKYIVEVENFS